MSKRVSAEEKQTRMLSLFHKSKSFFQLQELEKIAPKEKGIIANSVKDVVFKLVDQGLVDTDKIGTSVYFWSFQSKVRNAKKRKLEELKLKQEEYSKKLKLTTEKLEELKENEEEKKEKISYIDKINELTIDQDELINKIKKYEDDGLKNKRDQIEGIKIAANRWTDNVLSLKSWCKNKYCFEDSVLDKEFGIPSNFDYLE